MAYAIRVHPGARPRLERRDPRAKLGYGDKQAAAERLDAVRERLALLQQRLYAEGRSSVLLILQGLDAAGKDGVIRRVFTGLNQQSCRVVAFRAPSPEELAHDYLWRVHHNLPRRGEIGIFNRSHYEDVVTVRTQRLAEPAVWRARPAHIREFERMLADEGTVIVKVFLHVSREEQRKRLQERIDDPEKRWKLSAADLLVPLQFDAYMRAYEDAIAATSTEWAPWHVVPADRNWVKALAVAELLLDALERIDPQVPESRLRAVSLTD